MAHPGDTFPAANIVQKAHNIGFLRIHAGFFRNAHGIFCRYLTVLLPETRVIAYRYFQFLFGPFYCKH